MVTRHTLLNEKLLILSNKDKIKTKEELYFKKMRLISLELDIHPFFVFSV